MSIQIELLLLAVITWIWMWVSTRETIRAIDSIRDEILEARGIR